MTNYLISKVFFVMFMVFIGQITQAQSAWQLEKEDDGIKVYLREQTGSAVKSFKGEVVLSAHLTSVVTALEDTKSYPQIFHNCKSASDVKISSNTESYKYMVTKMPWPVENRDMIVHSILSQDKQTKQVHIQLSSAPKQVPSKEGLVRIVDMSGSWTLSPLGKDKVKVVYEMNVDPGGNIPKWLVNSLTVDIPFYTLDKLRKQLDKAIYKDVKHEVIVD